MKEKSELRKEIKHLRAQVSESDTRSQIAVGRLLGLQIYKQCKRLLCYSAFSSELDCSTLIRRGWKDNKEVFLPKVKSNEDILEFVKIDNFNELQPGFSGIKEPSTTGEKLNFEDLRASDLLIVPGLAFDKYGHRLGFGRGHYDRFIASLKIRPILVALVFDIQIVEEVPVEEHDCSVDYIFTETQVLESNKY